MSEKLHIITPSARPENLADLWVSMSDCYVQFDLHWWVVLDLAPQPLPLAFREILAEYGHRITVWFHHQPTPGAWGHPQRSAALDHIPDGWVWTLDDDNLCHPQFADHLATLFVAYPDAGAFVVRQQRADGRMLAAHPDHLHPEGVDTAQYIVRRDVIGEARVQAVPADDGGFIQRVYQAHPDRFVFVDTVLCYHNALTNQAWYADLRANVIPAEQTLAGGH